MYQQSRLRCRPYQPQKAFNAPFSSISFIDSNYYFDFCSHGSVLHIIELHKNCILMDMFYCIRFVPQYFTCECHSYCFIQLCPVHSYSNIFKPEVKIQHLLYFYQNVRNIICATIFKQFVIIRIGINFLKVSKTIYFLCSIFCYFIIFFLLTVIQCFLLYLLSHQFSSVQSLNHV